MRDASVEGGAEGTARRLAAPRPMEEDRLTTGSTEAVTPEPAAPVARTRAYEGMFVAFNKEARKTHEYLEEHIQALLTKVGAKVVRFHKWDQRQLAFEINGQREGIYYLVYFEAPTDVIAHQARGGASIVLRALVRARPHPDRGGAAQALVGRGGDARRREPRGGRPTADAVRSATGADRRPVRPDGPGRRRRRRRRPDAREADAG
jgi:ribosomal protein S6